MNEPRAVVREVDGQLVLDDPDALAMIRVVERVNCEALVRLNADRVKHFAQRAAELGRASKDVVIVILAVDDPNGGAIADILMPGHDWQAYRDRGEVPIARGLAGREGIQEVLDEIDPEAAAKLRKLTSDLAVVVVDRGVALVVAAGAVR